MVKKMKNANPINKWLLALAIMLAVLTGPGVFGEVEDLGKGFRHHGIATPVSTHRGVVATLDGAGKPIVLAWLFDHRGGYALLLTDVEAGKSEEYSMPFPPGGDCPYASILSSGNRFYTHFNSYFVEFDPARRAFTFWQKTAPQMAMSMTEDDQGRIWSVTYPQSGLVVFDPKTRKLQDYGHVYGQNWAQYPRHIAADDAGWVYFGIGSTRSQIIAFDPQTGRAVPMIPEDQRDHGYAYVYRAKDGKVYGQAVKGRKDNWQVFYKGTMALIGTHEQTNPKPYISDSQSLFHRNFPDGKRIETFDLVERALVVEDTNAGTRKAISLSYTSEGAHIMSLAAAPDNTICGGTAFPMRFFRYDPAKDEWSNRASYGQWNTVGRQGDHFFVGGYTGGFLLEWDPLRPWVATEIGKNDANPLFLTECIPAINRPHKLFAHPDGKTIVLAGTPDYGYTGGGLLFWDRQTKKGNLLTHTDLLPEHSTISLAALPENKLLGGTTTSPGTGGEKKAKEAELYILDMATRRIIWHRPVLAGVQEYTDLCISVKGLVYGFADRVRFFVFDPAKGEVIHEEMTEATYGRTAYQQGPRVFVPGPEGQVYILFNKGIARIEPATFRIQMLAESPVPIDYGGDILNGRIYFASGSHVYSYALPE
jgi:hypothetical protein